MEDANAAPRLLNHNTRLEIDVDGPGSGFGCHRKPNECCYIVTARYRLFSGNTQRVLRRAEHDTSDGSETHSPISKGYFER